MNIIITGASSGIGKAIAVRFFKQFPQANFWLLARRTDSLQELKDTFPDINIRYSQLDVRQRNAVQQWAAQLTDTWRSVDILVNNAGLALGAGPIHQGDIDDWDTMIDTNLKGLLYITKAVVPLMIKQSKGHILNMGSTAGKIVYTGGNVYCATKFAVDALGQAMRMDLLEHNIKVTNINPGMVLSEFSIVRFKGDTQQADKVYEGFEVLKPEDIAEIAAFCCSLPQHVCINDLTVTCTQQANSIYKHAKS